MDALINPELLRWARETAGLSLEEAAHRADISAERLAKAESGERNLSTIQLEKLARACRRPLAAFYLPKPPPAPEIIPDFRRLSPDGSKTLSVQLRLEIRRAQQRRSDVIELAAELEEPLQTFDLAFSPQTPTKEAASLIRKFLGISLERQTSWRKPEIALKEWKRAAENAGVLVFEVSRIPVGEMRGVALSLTPLPIIILNGADEPSARVFSLLHEMAHLAINVSAIDDGAIEGPGLSEQDAAIEKYCNEIAGEFLAPSNFVKEFLTQRQGGLVDVNLVAELAKQLSVSREVVARRLLNIGHIDKQQYQDWRQQFKEEYEQFLKARKEKNKNSKSGPAFEVIQARNLSQTFVRLAFDAYEQDHLSLSGVSSLLGMKVKGVFALRDLLREGLSK